MHHSISSDGLPDPDGISSPLGPLFLLALCLLRPVSLEDLQLCFFSLIVLYLTKSWLNGIMWIIFGLPKKDRTDCVCEVVDLLTMFRDSDFLVLSA